MPLTAHIIDVGCGNMILLILPNGSVFFSDCNITEENKGRVLSYVDKVIGKGQPIALFMNSHRDADHMRGVKSLHAAHSIRKIWDTGVPGTTTDSPEYKAYMELCRSVPTDFVKPRLQLEYGGTTIKIMNSQWDDYSDANEQSMVVKVENQNASLMLAGDTNYRPWKEKILTHIMPISSLKSSIILASHHGSITFFDDPSDSQNYVTAHIKKINPAMTLISVGPNVHGLPDAKAVELYEKYSTGSSQGYKVFRTDKQGTMRLVLKEDGGWELFPHQ